MTSPNSLPYAKHCLYSVAVFERLFDHVFAQRVARGLVQGEWQAIDSVPIKTNAPLNNLCKKQPLAAFIPVLTV
jgi:hypothetical protein